MRGRIRVMALVAIGTGLVVIACSKSKKRESTASAADTAGAAKASATAAAKADPAAEARKYFKENCGVCHGANGKGDGPGAANLIPKPQDFTDAKWQDKVKDDELKKAIVKGGMAVGRSPIMPAHPDLEDKPEVVDGLVKLIRRFKQK